MPKGLCHCGKRAHGLGLCHIHYKAFRKENPPQPKVLICHCGEITHARGMCQRHYDMWRNAQMSEEKKELMRLRRDKWKKDTIPDSYLKWSWSFPDYASSEVFELSRALLLLKREMRKSK